MVSLLNFFATTYLEVFRMPDPPLHVSTINYFQVLFIYFRMRASICCGLAIVGSLRYCLPATSGMV